MPRSEQPHPELLTTLSNLAVAVGHGRIPVAKKALQAAFEASLYRAAKIRFRGNQTRAAEYFGVSRTTVADWKKKYDTGMKHDAQFAPLIIQQWSALNAKSVEFTQNWLLAATEDAPNSIILFDDMSRMQVELSIACASAGLRFAAGGHTDRVGHGVVLLSESFLGTLGASLSNIFQLVGKPVTLVTNLADAEAAVNSAAATLGLSLPPFQLPAPLGTVPA